MVKPPNRSPSERSAFAWFVLTFWLLGTGCGMILAGILSILIDTTQTAHHLMFGLMLVGTSFLSFRGLPRGFRPLARFRSDVNAVSPVVAVVLMVAITVILAAIVFVLVSSTP